MKNHMKYIKLIGVFLLALVTSVACVKWEEEPTYDVGAPSTVTLNVVSASDSAFTISVSNSTDGFIAVNVFGGTGLAVPEDEETLEALLTGNVNSMEYVSVEATAGETYQLSFGSGIEQDWAYDIIAVANNTDGVVSAGQLATAVTSDSHAPVFLESDPAPTTDAILEQGGAITLYFDEYVVVGSGTFTFNTLFSGMSETGTAVAQGNMVVVTPPVDFPEGDYVFLSWEEGAITDPTGNAADAMTSGLDDEGYLMGLYFRMVRPERAEVSVAPDADSIAIGTDLVITYDDAVAADGNIEKGMITIDYYDADGVINATDYVDPAVLVFDGMTVTIPTSMTSAVAGGYLELMVAAEAFDIGFYVPNAELTAAWGTK